MSVNQKGESPVLLDCFCFYQEAELTSVMFKTVAWTVVVCEESVFDKIGQDWMKHLIMCDAN